MKRFRVISSEDQFKWSLPGDMEDYVNTYCQKFILDKDINEIILLNNPVPSNIDVPQSIHDFILPIMDRSEVAVDLSLTKIQQKVINVF